MLGVSKKKNDHGKNARVLVAEDDPAGRNLIKLILKKMKIDDVTYATDGLSAWQEIEKSERGFDLVISDWNMPIATGLELLEQMREEDMKTPFLMVTGRGLVESAVEAKMMGVTSFIPKPYSPQQMMRKIGEIISLK